MGQKKCKYAICLVYKFSLSEFEIHKFVVVDISENYTTCHVWTQNGIQFAV